MSSRPINVARVPCCGPNHRTWSCRIWGHLCCHFAIRSLMADTAAHTGHDPQRLSFVAALRITRQSIAHQGDFPLMTLTQPTAAGSPSHAGSPHA